MKKTLTLLLAISMLLCISGCTIRNTEEPPATDIEPDVSETIEPTLEPTPEPTPQSTPEPTPEPEPAYRNPLTGAPLSKPHTSRVTAVMLNNHPDAQPQCGMAKADIIYEVLAEGGITRMLALFSDIREADAIGSVRSARTYYADLAIAYDAIYVHAGGSEGSYGVMSTYGVDRMDGVIGPTGPDTFYRDADRRSKGYAYEHTLFTSGEKIYEFAQEQGYELNVNEEYDSGLRFAENAVPAEGENADKIQVKFINQTKFTNLSYDAEKGIYTAYQLGKDYADGITGENVEFDNVIILTARTTIIDNAGRRDIQLVGEGEGYFACGGKYVPIKWSRENVRSAFRYYNADGSELLINVGKTYIAIIPTANSSVIFE